MKILKDNFTKDKKQEYESVCCVCDSLLKFNESDIEHLYYGSPFFKCPLCGNYNEVDNEKFDLKLTKDNVKYPQHFWHTYAGKDSCSEVSDAIVNKQIKQCIDEMERNNEKNICRSFGNLFLYIEKNEYKGKEPDEFDYEITIARDFYSTELFI